MKTSIVILIVFLFVLACSVYCSAKDRLAPNKISKRLKASFYGEGYRGRTMADGAAFDPEALSCASWEWPLGTDLLVGYRDRTVIVRVTDRGPDRRLGRALDLSRAAFAKLADTKLGVIEVEVLVWARPGEAVR